MLWTPCPYSYFPSVCVSAITSVFLLCVSFLEAAVLPSIVFWSHVVRAFGIETRASFSEVSQFAAKSPFKILDYLYTAAYKAWALKSP